MRSKQWFMATAGCAVSFINVGLLLSLGALFHPISEKFQTARPATALVQSVFFAAQGFGVFVGVLVDKYGLWKISLIGTMCTVVGLGSGFFVSSILHLYIVSLVAGIGIAITGLCSTVAVEDATAGRAQSTAFAINSICIALGALVYPQMLAFLATTYGLNGTYLILGGVFCNNVLLVVVTLNLSSSTSVIITSYRYTPDSVVEKCQISNVRTTINTPQCEPFLYNMKIKILRIASIPYVLTWIASVANFSAADGYLISCVDIYTSMGFTEQQGISSMIIYQIGNISSSVVCVVMKQFKTMNTFAIPFVFSICGNVGIVFTYFAGTVQVAYTGAYFLGVSDGILTGTLLVLAEIVPKDLFGTALGIIVTSFSLASFAAGPVNGALRDATGSYAVPCLAIFIAFLFSAVLYVVAGLIQRKSNSLETPQSNVFSVTSSAAARVEEHSFSPEPRTQNITSSTYM